MRLDDGSATRSDPYWNRSEAVSCYAVSPYLLESERTAIKACFPEGLAGQRVLDLGCGGGRTTQVLHELGASVIGVDISALLIVAARQMFPKLDLRVANATSLPFEDASFDLVIIAKNALDYIDNKPARILALNEVCRVLSAHGRFILSHHNMAAWIFKMPRRDSLGFRLRHICNGDIFRSECFVPEDDLDAGECIPVYYSWPRKLLRDLEAMGFELIQVCPNQAAIAWLQRTLHASWVTTLAEPMPYYALRRRANS